MTWLAWRQFRLQTAVVYAALAVLVLMLIVSTRSVSDTTVYAIGWASVVAVPGIIGVFWGAPLVARELETGTHRLAWTQSITRTRWLATKLGLGTLTAMAAAGALSLVVTWWCGPIDTAINSGQSFQGILSVSRMEPPMFVARGIAPIGYTAFAFVLGATGGLLLRRTIPAMAVTLAVFIGVQIATPVVVRSQLAPKQLTTTITQKNLRGLIINNPGDPVSDVRIDVDKPGAWITTNSPADPSGRLVGTLPGWVSHCAPAPGQKSHQQACFTKLATAGYRQRVSYQPRDRYWTFQAIETAIFLALAGLMAGVCFGRIRRLG
jgi:ABC-type transport system involved in multi-copper enzyme maturation permease subunit